MAKATKGGMPGLTEDIDKYYEVTSQVLGQYVDLA